MPAPPTVDTELATRLRLSVARLARLLRQQDQSGLTPTMTAMLATVGRDGPLTLGQLAAAERVAPPTVTKLVAKLEAAGLLDRLPDAEDRRVTRVALSPAGRRQLDTIRGRRDEWLSARIEALLLEDRERLGGAVEVLERLVAP